MATIAPATPPATGALRSRRRSSASTGNDTLRKKALEKLTRAVAAAIETASDDTLADIVGSSDLRHALTIAPRDLAPAPPERLAAIKAAREKTVRFREDIAQLAGGMYDRTQVADLLGVTAAAIDKQRQRHQILGVPYGSEIRYPAAQFVDGEAIANLKQILEAFGDMHPWEQLQLLTTEVEGYGDQPRTIFDLLAHRPDAATLRQIIGLVSGWAA